MDPETIIQHLGENIGIESLKFSDEGVVSLLINDKFHTNIEKSSDNQTLTIYGKVGDLPVIDREVCLKALLNANLFGQKTGGASFGMDQHTEEIYLFKTFELENIQIDRFIEEVKLLIHWQQDWIQSIEINNYQHIT